jgi:hypothetical protein
MKTKQLMEYTRQLVNKRTFVRLIEFTAVVIFWLFGAILLVKILQVFTDTFGFMIVTTICSIIGFFLLAIIGPLMRTKLVIVLAHRYFVLISKVTPSINKYNELSIIALMLKKIMVRYYHSYVILLIFILIYCIARTMFHNTSILLILCSALVLLIINHLSLLFRINRGYYGSSEYEIREILQFLVENTDSNDLSNGNKIKQLFSVKELCKQSQIDIDPHLVLD